MVMEEKEQISSNIDDRIDQLEAEMTGYKLVNCPLYHKFTPGMYSRTVFMPKDALVVSLIHNTKHQFIVSQGRVSVRVNEDKWELIEAPFIGVTMPGTRRVLCIEDDCIWTTFHVTDIQPINDSDEAVEEAAERVMAAITKPHVNKYLGGQLVNNVLIKTIQE